MKKKLIFILLFIFSVEFVSYSDFFKKNNPTSDSDFTVRTSKNLSDTYVYPSGHSCGVKILTDGILVIAISPIDNSMSPADLSGIIPGDFITKANNKKLKNSNHLIRIVKESKGMPIEITYKRNNEEKKTVITPIKTINREYALGFWVRDSSAGLGTLTFISADKSKFAALGHPMSDIDTGEIMKLKEGQLVNSKIVSQIKGQPGKPGELVGVFEAQSPNIGIITNNTSFGIYGNTNNINCLELSNPIPVGKREEVKVGKAEILSTISGTKPEKFQVEITKINKQNNPDTKSFEIKITDPNLIEKTGGIVQGMSGSPIIQNGKLVGAVTHVLVNDPTRGYGIFIENMLEAAG